MGDSLATHIIALHNKVLTEPAERDYQQRYDRRRVLAAASIANVILRLKQHSHPLAAPPERHQLLLKLLGALAATSKALDHITDELHSSDGLPKRSINQDLIEEIYETSAGLLVEVGALIEEAQKLLKLESV